MLRLAPATTRQLYAVPWHFRLDVMHEARLQLLIGELGLQCYNLEKAEYPDGLEDLVPDYLPAVPMDPFSGAPFVYDRAESPYRLYSVGPDGRDEGGRWDTVVVAVPNPEAMKGVTVAYDLRLERTYPKMIVVPSQTPEHPEELFPWNEADGWVVEPGDDVPEGSGEGRP